MDVLSMIVLQIEQHNLCQIISHILYSNIVIIHTYNAEKVYVILQLLVPFGIHTRYNDLQL